MGVSRRDYIKVQAATTAAAVAGIGTEVSASNVVTDVAQTGLCAEGVGGW